MKEAGEISWTDVNSLKKGLSAIRKEIVINALEESETRRNVALHKRAYVRIGEMRQAKTFRLIFHLIFHYKGSNDTHTIKNFNLSK